MDEHLQQIAEALKAAADPTVTDNDVADAMSVVETVERMLRTKDAQARELAAARSALDVLRDRCIAACNERDTAQAALGDERANAAHWRGEATVWQARYEGMEAALRVVMEVRK